MMPFATESEISTYVGVDNYCDLSGGYFTALFKGRNIEGRFHFDDMLRFLAQQPSESAHVCMNGIDYDIVPSNRYSSELMVQIARIVPPKGIIFGVDSDLRSRGLESLGFSVSFLSISDEIDGLCIYEKREQ